MKSSPESYLQGKLENEPVSMETLAALEKKMTQPFVKASFEESGSFSARLPEGQLFLMYEKLPERMFLKPENIEQRFVD